MVRSPGASRSVGAVVGPAASAGPAAGPEMVSDSALGSQRRCGIYCSREDTGGRWDSVLISGNRQSLCFPSVSYIYTLCNSSGPAREPSYISQAYMTGWQTEKDQNSFYRPMKLLRSTNDLLGAVECMLLHLKIVILHDLESVSRR